MVRYKACRPLLIAYCGYRTATCNHEVTKRRLQLCKYRMKLGPPRVCLQGNHCSQPAPRLQMPAIYCLVF